MKIIYKCITIDHDDLNFKNYQITRECFIKLQRDYQDNKIIYDEKGDDIILTIDLDTSDRCEHETIAQVFNAYPKLDDLKIIN